MLAMGAPDELKNPADRLRELNIVPLTISYEFDPCDYLKAQELQEKRDIPGFKKSRQDDPVNTWIDELAELPKTEFFTALAQRMDKDIHRGYRLFPCNYIALDELEGSVANAAHYTAADKAGFEQYLAGQLAKISIPNKDEAFLREECMLKMYANPAVNQIEVRSEK